MPKIKVNNVELHYEEFGNGEETLFFSHGYLMNKTMFDSQIDALKESFRCVAYDHRGHGKSETSKAGYELDNLVTDAIMLIEKLDRGPVHFIGMSTGGFVGMRIALRKPELLKSMILIDSSAEAESKASFRRNNLLVWVVKNFGWTPAIGKVMPILFHKTFLKDTSRKEEVDKWRNIITGHNKKGLVPFGKGIFARKSILKNLANINIQTAVIVGENDLATPIEYSRRMADVIPNAAFYSIPDAGHSAAVEKPNEVTKAIKFFFETLN